MNDDPYGHLFIHCTITRHYINIPTLSQNICKITNNPNNPSFTILNNPINPIFNSKFKPDHHIHGYYLSDRNTTGKFEWSYRDLNFDLNRTEAYRNYISIILHYVWIWICKILFNLNLSQTDKFALLQERINFETIHKKWIDIINLELSKTAQQFNIIAIKNNQPITTRNQKWSNWIKKFKQKWIAPHIDTTFPLINY
ncbi:hypothetical protein ACTFIY_011521 [Dictyostelium cf. discoideum]